MKKLAIITTHPIQYNAPLFRLLTERKNIKVKIFYTWSQTEKGEKYDPGFGQNIIWDIPLLSGYDYVFVNNISKEPGSHYFKGINNPTLNKEIKEWGANALLIYGWNFKSHLSSIRFFSKKIPIFFRGDSTLLDEKKGFKKILRRILLRFVYSYINVAFYAGLANKNYFKAMGLQENQLVFMPHAIDNNRFLPSDENIKSAKNLRQILHISEDAIVFLFAGKLEKKKQPEFLIDCFISLNTVNAVLVIAGSGELEKVLKEKYSSHKRINFIGFQNQYQMPAVYNCCDVFILPSKGPNETWGLSINEAMAAGKAVVATDKCGASYDLITNNKNGFVFESNDNASLTRILIFFIENINETKIMGDASTNIIKEYSFFRDCITIEKSLTLWQHRIIK